MRAWPAALVMLVAGCGAKDEPKPAPKPVVPCAGVDRRYDPATARFDEKSIGAHLFRDPALIRVTRLMRQGRWAIAWSSPTGVGPSIYVMRRNGPLDEIVGEGALGEAHSRAQVAAWAMSLERHRPDPMPATLAWCLADALVG